MTRQYWSHFAVARADFDPYAGGGAEVISSFRGGLAHSAGAAIRVIGKILFEDCASDFVSPTAAQKMLS